MGEKGDSGEAMSPNDHHQHSGVNSAGWRKSLGFGYGRNSFAGLDPERHAESGGIVPTHTVTTLGSIPNPPPPPRLTEKERVMNWVNRRLLPPKKRYPFGLNRRRFCLLVLLPLLLLLLLGLALGLGLGLGLKKHDNDDSNLPLPPPFGEDPPLTAYQGTFTYYSASDRTGACGVNSDNDVMDVAISYKIWDEVAKRDEAAKSASNVYPQTLPYSEHNPQWRRNPLCGKKIWIGQQEDIEQGDWLEAMIIDRCGPDRCPEAEDIDLTVNTFEKVYNISSMGVFSDSDEEEDGAREGWWAWTVEW